MNARARRFLAALLLFTLALLALLHGINFLVDPLQVYRKSTWLTPLFTEEQRLQVPGLIRNYSSSIDTAIIGSSITGNLRSSEVNRIIGGKSLKLSVDGSTAHEHRIVARRLLQRENVARVIWGIDTLNYADQYGKVSRADSTYSSHLYGEGPELLHYTLSVDTLIHSSQTLLHHAFAIPFFRKKAELNRLNTWERPTGCVILLKSYDIEIKKTGWFRALGKSSSIEQLSLHLTALRELVDAFPETTFYFFFPPYSTLRMKLTEHLGMLPLFATVRDTFAERMLTAKNVQIYDFQNHFELSDDFNLYRDLGHFEASVNPILLKDIADGHSVSSLSQMKKRTETLAQHVRNFDLDKARRDCIEKEGSKP